MSFRYYIGLPSLLVLLLLTFSTRVDAVIIGPCFGGSCPGPTAPVFSLQFGVQSPPGQNAALVVLATVNNVNYDGSTPISLGTAAAELGVSHFNWIQMVNTFPTLTACAAGTINSNSVACNGLRNSSGSFPTLPTVDPPLGGWAYELNRGYNFPAADYQPFYWDDYLIGNNVISNDLYYSNQVIDTKIPNFPAIFTPSSDIYSSMGIILSDQPGSDGGGFVVPGTMDFTDELVGVIGTCTELDPNACSYVNVAGTQFTWSDTNGVVASPDLPFFDANGYLDTNYPIDIIPSTGGSIGDISEKPISLAQYTKITENYLSPVGTVGFPTAVPELPTAHMLFISILSLGLWRCLNVKKGIRLVSTIFD